MSPLGIAVRTVRGHFDDVGDAVSAVIGKLKSAWDWIAKVAGKASSLPGVGLLGDVAGGIGGFLSGRAYGGGVAAGQAVTVGERGRETFLPTVPGVVLPNLTTTPDVDDMLGDTTGLGRSETYVFLDSTEIAARVVTRFKKQVARA